MSTTTKAANNVGDVATAKINNKVIPAFDAKVFAGNEIPGIDFSGFDKLRITAEKIYPNYKATITWDDAAIAAPGNITAISASFKAGKSATKNVFVAGAISQDGFIDGFDGIEVVPNKDGKAVIDLDTEQSEYDQQYNLKTTMARAGYENTPDFYLAYNIRQLSIDTYKKFTDIICEAAASEFNGIHSIYIDGGADYIKSVNDEEKATEIVEYFTHLAIRYDCPVIIVVHTNPGSDKERGHFGSQVQRKCYGLISIKKDGDVSCAEPKAMRKAGASDIKPIYYKFSKEKGYHVQIDEPKAYNKSAAKLGMIEAIIREAIPTSKVYGYNDAVRQIIKVAKATSETTGKNYLKVALANDWIIKTDEGLYTGRAR